NVYATGLPNFRANRSAILFSKPSPASSDRGRSRGSAQARKTCGSTSSIEPSASYALTRPGRAIATSARIATMIDFIALAIASLTHALRFGFSELRRLVFMLGGPSAGNRILRASAQIHVNVVKIARHILIIGKSRHDLFLAGADILLAARYDSKEFRIANRLQRICERGRIGRALSIGAVANVAFRMIPTEAGIRVPANGPNRGRLHGRVATLCATPGCV